MFTPLCSHHHILIPWFTLLVSAPTTTWLSGGMPSGGRMRLGRTHAHVYVARGDAHWHAPGVGLRRVGWEFHLRSHWVARKRVRGRLAPVCCWLCASGGVLRVPGRNSCPWVFRAEYQVSACSWCDSASDEPRRPTQLTRVSPHRAARKRCAHVCWQHLCYVAWRSDGPLSPHLPPSLVSWVPAGRVL